MEENEKLFNERQENNDETGQNQEHANQSKEPDAGFNENSGKEIADHATAEIIGRVIADPVIGVSVIGIAENREIGTALGPF